MLLPIGQLHPLMGMGVAVNIMLRLIYQLPVYRYLHKLFGVLQKQLNGIQDHRVIAELPEVMFCIRLIAVGKEMK